MSSPSRDELERGLSRLLQSGALAAEQVADLLGASRRLIVYGSLAPGGTNHHVVVGLAGTWRSGWITGGLLEVGWGAEHGYPALRWDPAGERIAAHLLESSELPGFWSRLDAFEGDGYRRILVPFLGEDGSCVAGQVYAYRESASSG